jgi:choline dehydrogenase
VRLAGRVRSPSHRGARPADAEVPLIVASLLLSGPLILDINSRAAIDATGVSLASNTVSSSNVRSSVRERLLAVQAASPSRLQFALDTLATKVLLCQDAGAGAPSAYGVEIARGQGLPVQLDFGGKAQLQTEQVLARREVILAAGVFQTPQLVRGCIARWCFLANTELAHGKYCMCAQAYWTEART